MTQLTAMFACNQAVTPVVLLLDMLGRGLRRLLIEMIGIHFLLRVELAGAQGENESE